MGEYAVSGKVGEDLEFAALPSRLSDAQSELGTFSAVQTKLVEVGARKTQFNCTTAAVLGLGSKCDPVSVIIASN